MNVSSPLSTGEAGAVFEQHVGAMFLSLLLIRGIPAVFRNSQVEEVSFQTRRLGWETDDLLVTCSSPNGRRRLAMQIRRRFTVRKSDECKKTIQRFWNDFCAQDRFDQDKDALVLATLQHTDNLGGFASLSECARSSPGPDDFKDRLETPRFMSDMARKCYQEVHSIVDSMTSSGSIDEGVLWRFLKTIYVLYLDFTTDTAQQEATVMQWLAQSSSDPDATDASRTTWYKLTYIAANAAFRAKTFCRTDLPDDMLQRYGAIPSRFLHALEEHSKFVLNGIYSTIGETTTLPRTELITKVNMALGDKVVALTGPAGSGKSALAKAVIKQHRDNRLCLSFRATEFAKSHIDKVLPGSTSGEQFRSFIESQERVLIYVDALEGLLEYSVHDAFGDLVTIVKDCSNVSLILTCRDSEMKNVIMEFFGRNSPTCHTISMPQITADETEQILKDIPGLKTPLSNPGLAQIMGMPYALNMAARMDWSDQDTPAGLASFRKKWWHEIVRKDTMTANGMPDRRQQTLIGLAMRRARDLRSSIPTDGMDTVALDKLHKDSIVVVDDGFATLTHDIIEDWAIILWIESRAKTHEWGVRPMCADIGTHPAVRRGFREWLKEWLDTDSNSAEGFVLAAHGDGSLRQHFLDDVIISVLLSDSIRNLVVRQKDRMLADDARLLVRMMGLTQVACMGVPDPPDGQPRHEFALLEPKGEAWPVLLEVIDNNLERLLPGLYGHILCLLECWARRYQSPEMPEGSASAISVAYALLLAPTTPCDDERRILEIIAGVPRADSGRFLSLLEQVSSRSKYNNVTLGKFRDILMGRLGFPACRDFPEEMVRFVLSLCIPKASDPDSIWTRQKNFFPEFKFGLYSHTRSNFLHLSAFRGPFWPLLLFHPDIGIHLILYLVNRAGDWYGEKGADKVPRVTVLAPGNAKVIQWADNHLWQAYRGVSEAPAVIVCALMALEHWLLKMCEHGHSVESHLSKILQESGNVMTTGVVASLCIAHPDLCGAIPDALSKSEDCIRLDQFRVKNEGDFPRSIHAAVSRENRYYDDERQKSNALPHRRLDLKSLRQHMHLPLQYDGGTETKMHESVPDAGKIHGGVDHISAKTKECPSTDASILLHAWGMRRWKREDDDGDIQPWRRVLAMSKDMPHVMSDPKQPAEDGPSTVAAVCVRDHWEDMSHDDRLWCASMLVNEIQTDCDSTDFAICQVHCHVGAGQAAARMLPKILAYDPDNREILKAVARAVTHAVADVSCDAARGVAEYLEPNHQNLMLRCAGAVAMLSNSVSDDGDVWLRTEWRPILPGSGDTPNPRELARRAFVEGRVDVEGELKKLVLTSWHGRNAAGLIIRMLGNTPDLPLTTWFINKTLQAVLDTKTKERGVLHVGPDLEFENNIMNSLAGAILTMPREMPNLYRPLLDAVDTHPDKAARFIETLLLRKSLAEHTFWNVWQAFADRIVELVESSHIDFDDYRVEELVRMMLFNMRWDKDSQHWKHLADHSERVNKFVRRLPPAPYVLASFAFYLYKTGKGSPPNALSIVASHLGAENQPVDKNTVYLLASVLDRYVYRNPKPLRADPNLRKDAVLILNRLVESGSPEAYKMRDHFTAPNGMNP